MLRADAQDDSPDTRLYDTVRPPPAALTPAWLSQRAGWRQIPEDNVTQSFMGAAVVLNDRLALVFQNQKPGPQVYSRLSGRLLATAGFVLAAPSTGQLIDNFTIVENTAAGVRLQANYGKNGGLRFRLTTGEPLVEVQSPSGDGSLLVESKTEHVLVPDYFGDDLVYTPPVSQLLPAENFCLNLLAGSDAILMTVWQSSLQDASIAPAATAQSGTCLTRVTCMTDKKIWIASLESPALWHAQNAPDRNAWQPPFAAKWRCSFVREKNEADSWDFDRGPEPDQTGAKHEGPLLTYLIDRTPATPLTASCPTDVMRNTLGVGPCQYILACEGMGAQGDPTPNSVMGWVEKQFQQNKQRKAADEIRERLGFMTRHVADARTKIQRYAELSTRLQKIISEQQGYRSLKYIADELSRFAAAGLTPESAPDRARQLASEVEKLVTGPNGRASCEKLGEQLRAIGAIQDRALARCRMAVRRLRQEARTLASSQAAAATSVRQIQTLAEESLQNK